MKISEIIIDKYKLRIPPTVYYDLLADVVEVEEEQEPTPKNNLGVDWDELKRKILMEVDGGTDDAWLAYGDVWKRISNSIDEYVQNIKALPSVTPQLSVPEVTALAEWTAKLTKASEDAYNKGYADGMKAQEPVLDKIRADITKFADTIPFNIGEVKAKYRNIGQHDGLEQALEIIEGNLKGDFDIDEWMAENE